MEKANFLFCQVHIHNLYTKVLFFESEFFKFLKEGNSFFDLASLNHPNVIQFCSIS